MTYQLAKKRLIDTSFMEGEPYERKIITKIAKLLSNSKAEEAYNALEDYYKEIGQSDSYEEPQSKTYFMREVAGIKDYPWPKGSRQEKEEIRKKKKEVFGPKKEIKIGSGENGVIYNKHEYYKVAEKEILNSLKNLMKIPGKTLSEVKINDRTNSYLAIIPKKIMVNFIFDEDGHEYKFDSKTLHIYSKEMKFDEESNNILFEMVNRNRANFIKAKNIIINILKKELKEFQKKALSNKDYRLYLSYKRSNGEEYGNGNGASQLRYEDYTPNYFPY